MKTHLYPAIIALVGIQATASPIDLSGEWRFALDPQDQGISASPSDWKFPDRIHLPGILTNQGFGEVPNFRTDTPFFPRL